MLNEKKISKSGSITIPSHLRRELGIENGEKVKIDVEDNGKITLTRIVGSCIICGSNENLSNIDDKYICKDCIDRINNREVDKTKNRE